MHQSYKELKNFIHNEEGISREDIQELIRYSVQVEVEKVISNKQDYIDQCVKEYIERLIREGLTDGGRLLLGFKERVSSTLSAEVGKLVAKQLDISVNLKNDKS